MRQSLQAAIQNLDAYLAKLRADRNATPEQIASVEQMIANLRAEVMALASKEGTIRS